MDNRFADVEIVLDELHDLVNDPELQFELYIPDPLNPGSSMTPAETLLFKKTRYEDLIIGDKPVSPVHRKLMLIKLTFEMMLLDLDKFHSECMMVRENALLPFQLRRSYPDRVDFMAHVDDYFLSHIVTSDVRAFLVDRGAQLIPASTKNRVLRTDLAVASIRERRWGILARLLVDRQ